MRIVSLLPSATESLFALGLGDRLVAVTHECDFPPDARELPCVTRSTLGLEGKQSSGIEETVSLAGIDDSLARAGVPSVALSWAEVRSARPELLVLAPCGFDRKRAEREAQLVRHEIDEVGARRVVVLDGSAYFNRPGPRLVDSLELLVASR